MPRPSIWRERNFDREADFVIKRQLRIDGKDHLPGQLLDKTLVSTRTLRSLFEQRKIEFVDGEMPSAYPMRPLRSVQERNAAIRASRAIPLEKIKVKRVSQQTDQPFVKHFGHGRWAVAKGSERLTEFTKKNEANEKLKEMFP